jgi:hypothetical protein
MRWTKFTALLLALGLGATAMDAIAETVIYRWVDEDGVVHFGNQPPIDVQATVVNKRSPTPSRGAGRATVASSQPQTAQADGGPELSAAEQSRLTRADRRKSYTEKQHKLEADCEIMRRQRDWVEPSPRVLVAGDDGEPRRLSDEERDEMLNEANTFLAENCD